MAEIGGPSLEDIAKAAGSKVAEQGIATESSPSTTQGLPEPLSRILIRKDSEEYHKHKESLGERPNQLLYREPPGLAHSTAMPAGSAGGSSITSDLGQAVDQTQVQTPASSLPNTSSEVTNQRLKEQAPIVQSPVQSGSAPAASAD